MNPGTYTRGDVLKTTSPRRITIGDLPVNTVAQQDTNCCGVERKMTPIEEQVSGLASGLKGLSDIVSSLEDSLSPILEPEKCCDAGNEKDARPVQASLVVELRGLNESLYYLTNRVRSIRARIQL